MTTLLIKSAHAIATLNDERGDLRDAFILIRDGVIESLGPFANAPLKPDELIDASSCVVIPGLVNTHHHMYQTLTRAIPAVQDAELFTWLKGRYPNGSKLDDTIIQQNIGRIRR